MNAAPPQDLQALETLLARRPPDVAERIRRIVTDVRPCVMARSARVGTTPLRGTWGSRLLGKTAPPPALSPVTSKFGGRTYAEDASEIRHGRFLGQIDFSEAKAALSAERFPIPDGMPDQGLLAIDMLDGALQAEEGVFQARTRWYPTPDAGKCCDTSRMRSYGRFEAGIRYAGGWSLHGLEWYAAVPEQDDELWDFMNSLEFPGIDEDDRCHRLFGHMNEVLNEHDGCIRAPGRSASIRDYRLVWRINFDNQAGFAWGTNWLYAIIHRDDLLAGAFENVIVTVANA